MAKKTNDTFIRCNGEIVPCFQSDFCITSSPVWVSDDMSGKMRGIPSVSTSCLVNPFCLARMKNKEAICARCFAESQQKKYKASREHAIANYHLLNDEILPLEVLPLFGNVRKVRIESFGDLGSVIHAVNYLNMIIKNPAIGFTWWTKNHNFVIQAIEKYFGGVKPKNLILVASSLKVNKAAKLPKYFDKVFTVYDDEFITENGIDINCGSRFCMGCMRCYGECDEVEVRERLK